MALFTPQFRVEWPEHIALEYDADAQGRDSLCSCFEIVVRHCQWFQGRKRCAMGFKQGRIYEIDLARRG
jgi:hypothetical protein